MSYWTYNTNTNGLKGLDGRIVALDDCYGRSVYLPDEENPAVLQGGMILYALRTSQKARNDFQRLFPTLLPEEQDRLTTLIEAFPRLAALELSEQQFSDDIQANWNKKIPVRTSGPRGGLGGTPDPYTRTKGKP